MDEDREQLVITSDLLDGFESDFRSDPTARLAMNACWKNDPMELCLNRDKIYETNHVFSHKVEAEGKPLSHQKASGRCWIFACLNTIRLPFMKFLNVDEFEFSQAYLFFCDKIERCNYFLNKIVECFRNNEQIEGRLISYLLSDPVSDGGQWQMLVNLITKHGLMPKKCFPDSFCAENSMKLNIILETKLREYVRDLHDLLAEEDEGQSSQVVPLLQKQMKEIFRIVSICLGIPPRTLTFNYYDKTKNFHTIGPITPLQFYLKMVQPVFDVTQKVCLVNDPRPNNGYGRTYTIDCLGNMVGGQPVVYANQPIEVLMRVAADSIKNGGEAVWFGCEVMKRFNSRLGIHDVDLHDIKGLLGVDANLPLSKSERMLYGDSLMTHAMAFTATTEDASSPLPTKWRVENSWGEDVGEKGYHVLTAEWFRQFVFEVVVDRRFVPKEVLDVIEAAPPIVLPAWDPMGSLASPGKRCSCQF